MDMPDGTGVGQIEALLNKAEANIASASLRKGETPRDHPSPLLLIQRHMLQLQAHARMPQEGYTTAISQIPAPYPPCIHRATELRPILISQMKLETHHRGSKVVVRVMLPPTRITAIVSVVEDEKGTATILQLYNQPPEQLVPASQSLRQGCFYLLKEPFFKGTADGSYSLRVDHVSDVVLLDDSDELVPEKWRKTKTIAETSQGIRMRGNKAVGQQNWAEAERLYTSAIAAALTPADEQMAYLNRSLANLRLERPAKALSDAIMSTTSNNGQSSEKGLFREAHALYQLHRFDDCLDRLKPLINTCSPGLFTAEAKMMLIRAKARMQEKKMGKYDFLDMYKQAEATPPIIDCATYSAAVEVRESPGRGRGLFTTRKVAAGDLLLCEKAFGYRFVDKDGAGQHKKTGILMNLVTKRIVVGGAADLLPELVQKLYHDPEASKLFTNLHHGDYSPVSVDEVDGKPVVDSFLTERIMALNAFGAPRTSRLSVTLAPNITPDQNKTPPHFETCGIWYLASYINHACISNCRRSYIGDMQIVRAAKDLDEGTELFFWYQIPRSHDFYHQSQKQFKSWGFKCVCPLCMERKLTTNETWKRRQTLEMDLVRAMGNQVIDATKAQHVLQSLEQTYSASALKPGGVRLELWEPYFALGHALCAMRKRPLEALEMILKGFEALGFVIVASPRLGTSKSQEAKLEIKQWGLPNDFSVILFLQMSQLYVKLAPVLTDIAISYAETSYAIIIGEKETFTDAYPDFK